MYMYFIKQLMLSSCLGIMLTYEILCISEMNPKQYIDFNFII